ncbi:MAG: YaiI/YqxD family protein [Enterococcus sp.]
MKIFIDGDGSPVKSDAVAVAKRFGLEVVIVTSVAHYTNKEYPANVSFVYVDQGADSADYRIVALIQSGDLLVTQDYGLASLVLPKGVRVFHQTGMEYSGETMNLLLEQRYQSSRVRKAGGKTKGPKAFTNEERQKFIQAFTHAVQESQTINDADGTR